MSSRDTVEKVLERAVEASREAIHKAWALSLTPEDREDKYWELQALKRVKTAIDKQLPKGTI